MTTAYITHPDCLRHDMGAGHPECPDRLTSVNDAMRAAGLLAELRCLEAPLAEVAQHEQPTGKQDWIGGSVLYVIASEGEEK